MPLESYWKQELEILTRQASDQAIKNPWRYRLKLTVMALFGYCAVYGSLFLLLSMTAGLSWLAASAVSVDMMTAAYLFAAFLSLLMIFALFKFLWVKFDAPAGYELKPDEFPKLFRELTLLSQSLRAPVIERIVLSSGYNATIVQTPCLGLFGWKKNTLLLGLELLFCTTPQETRSLIVHELVHLSAKYQRFSGWIYRLRLSWLCSINALKQQNHSGKKLLWKFLNWYGSKFAAFAFPMARANEICADSIAASMTSKEDLAQALAKRQIMPDLLLETFWQKLVNSTGDTAPSELSPYTELQVFLKSAEHDRTVVASLIDRAMRVKTSQHDTHPALKERLSTLSSQLEMPTKIRKSAAKFWFEERLPDIVNDFDNEWLQKNTAKWRDRYHLINKGLAKLAHLKAKPLHKLPPPEILELAALTKEFAPDEDCLPLYELYREHKLHDTNVLFTIGKLLLARNDESGVEKLTQAIEKQANLKQTAYDLLIDFYRRRDDEYAVNFWLEKAERLHDINTAAEKERSIVSISDELVKPDRKMDIYNLFTARIMVLDGVNHAWLAEKRMRFYPETKTYLLVIEKGLFSKENKLINLVTSLLDSNITCFVFLKNGKQGHIAGQVIKKGIKLF